MNEQTKEKNKLVGEVKEQVINDTQSQPGKWILEESCHSTIFIYIWLVQLIFL